MRRQIEYAWWALGGAVRQGALLFWSCIVLATGCECPEPEGSGCIDMLHIGFEKETDWDDGEYVITIAEGGDEIVCVDTLPGGRDVLTTPCSEDDVTLEWRDKGRRLEYVRIRWKVDFATVTVTHDGNVIGSAEFEPVYEKYNERPRRCGATCVRDTVFITLE